MNVSGTKIDPLSSGKLRIERGKASIVWAEKKYRQRKVSPVGVWLP